MRGPPNGTVTFLLCEIDGSTSLWERHPAAMGPALTRYRAAVTRLVTERGGYLFRTLGESCYAAFEEPNVALRTAWELQRAMAGEDWGPVERLLPRVALHTGAVERAGDDYASLALSRATQLLAAAHGGQILLSRVTHDLVCDQLPVGMALRDLGLHELVGFSRGEQIFQLAAPGLQTDFPPLRTARSWRRNLPAPATSLLGRADELAAALNILRDSGTRLLTLTGPGGVGKTRLALALAEALWASEHTEVWFVPLADVDSGEQALAAIAQTLGVSSVQGPIVSRIAYALRERRTLLLLDNFEQLLPAAPIVAELLAAAPGLRLLVTSRAPLHIYGEYEYAVPPLGLPPAELTRGLANLDDFPATAFFLARARAAGAPLQRDGDHAADVAAICVALDGLPLAIELAAARSKLLPPTALLKRLDDRLRLLVGGARDLPARQQTMRGAIAWSYDLLDAHSQRLQVSMGVFVGGCRLEALETVCAGTDLEPVLLDSLGTLVDQSLVRQEPDADGVPRFMMLETVRAFAQELLCARPEAGSIRRRHAMCFLALAEAAAPELRGPGQAKWLLRLDRDHGNLRAALAWALDAAQQPGGAPTAAEAATVALRLVAALGPFWAMRGYASEARTWVSRALALRDLAPPEAEVKALLCAGELGRTLGDFPAAQHHFEQALALSRAAALPHSEIDALTGLGAVAWSTGDFDAARQSCEQALAYAQRLDYRRGIAQASTSLGIVAHRKADLPEARRYLETALAQCRDLGDRALLANVLGNLGAVATYQGDFAGAHRLYTEAISICQSLGDRQGIARGHNSLGGVATFRGDFAAAQRHYEEALTLCGALGDRQGSALALANLGNVAGNQGNFAAARQYFADTLALCRDLGDRYLEAATLFNLGRAVCATGEYAAAEGYFHQSLALHAALGDQRSVAYTLEGLATLLALNQRSEQGVRRYGAADAIRARIATPLSPAERADIEPRLAELRAALGDRAFAAAWEAGRALTLAEAIAEGLMDALAAPLPPPAPPPPAPPPHGIALTEREVEVLRLLARGLADAEIAEKLVISVRTVQSHLRSIYRKLQVSSRTAAAGFAHTHGYI